MRTASNSLYSLAQLGIARLAGVITVIILAQLQGPEAVGVFSIAITFHLILTGWWTGLDDKVVRSIAYTRSSSPEAVRQFTWRAVVDYLQLRTVVGAILMALIIAFVLYSGAFSVIESRVINIFALSTITDNAILVLVAGYVGNERFVVALQVVALQAILRIILTAAALLFAPEMVNLAVAWLVASFITAVVSLSIFVIQYHTPRHRVQTRSEGAWGIIAQLRGDWSFWLIGIVVILEYQLDIILLSLFHGATEVGYYSVATTFFALVTLPVQAFRNAIYPAMSRAAAVDGLGQSPDGQYNLARMQSIYDLAIAGVLSIVLPSALFGYFFAAPMVTLVFGEAMSAAIAPTQILMIVVIVFGMNVPQSRFLLATRQQTKAAQLIIVSALVNVIANIWLGQVFGASGAALARGISTLTFFVPAYLSVRAMIVWHGWRLVAPSILATLVTSAFLVASATWLWWQSATIGVLLFIGAWFLAGGLTSIRALQQG